MEDERIRKLELRIESLRETIREQKRKLNERRNELAYMTIKMQQVKGQLSQPSLNTEEKKQLRLLKQELKQCKEQL